MHLGDLKRPICPLIAGWLALMAISGQAQTSLNVTNFGAVGDAVQVWVSTVSNSPSVIFTNVLTSADIGKTIELFGVGDFTTATNNQDLIAVITSVVNGTNAYISGDIPEVTSNRVYCIYGTQNAPAFQAAANAAKGTNTIINIPAGTFLMIPPEQYTNFAYSYYPYAQNDAAILLKKGGLHFIGAGEGQTVLMADGAFKSQGYTCMRGGIFIVDGPITNDYPLIWEGLTFDGGLQLGLVGSQGIQPANWQNGLGWDGFSFAGLDAGSEPLNTFKKFVSCEFRHFRGEVIKGITGSARNETVLVTNCIFWDNNATAFNYNFAHTIADCTFSNMYQAEEFYLEYPTNAPSYFIDNYVTNMSHAIIALNGGTLTNQPYIISNNVFYCTFNGIAIATAPASSVLIASNLFVQVTNYYSQAVAIGIEGAQPGSADACNTNITITGNTFVNPFFRGFVIGGISATDVNRAANVQVYNNSFMGAAGESFLQGTYATDINIYSNDMHGAYLSFSCGNYGGQFASVGTNNNYWTRVFVNGDSDVYTNCVSYGNGSRWWLTYPYATNASVVLVDTNGSQIPIGAQMLITNGNWSSANVPIYLNSAMTRGPVNLPYGQTFVASWTNGVWINISANGPAAPTNVRVIVPGP
jgi:hypothetical protein